MRWWCLALLCLLIAPAPASAAARWELTTVGDPRLSRHEAEKVSFNWWVCPPADQCRWFDASLPVEPVEPGETARGSFFESDWAVFTTERSPMWMGRARALNHPRVRGSLRAGQRVGPVGALWTGGWANDLTTTVMVACPQSARAECEYLAGPGGAITGDGPRTLLAKHVGWYVYTVQYRTALDSGPPLLAPGRAPRPAASALVAVSERGGLVKRAQR